VTVRSLAFLILLAMCLMTAMAQTLRPYVDAEGLHLRSPDLRLLSPEARQRLRNGVTVTYAFRVSLAADRRGARRSSVSYHCVFSYDLWEEKYKVVRLEPGYRSASRLSQAMAEQLCLESLVIPLAGLAVDSPFWVFVEYQMEDRNPSPGDADSRTIPGVLIDIFSKRTGEAKSFFTLEAGPFRLSELRGNK
jgi:hypothetical protein